MKTWICRVFVWIGTIAYISAAYLVVALALDRVMAILRPFWYRRSNFPKIGRRITLVITVTSAFISMPNLFTVEPTEGDSNCGRRRRIAVVTISQMIIVFLIPAAILILSNIIFISRLFKRRKKLPAQRNVKKSRTSNESEAPTRMGPRLANEQNYVKMLLATSCSYLVLMFSTIALNIVGLNYSQLKEKRQLGQTLWSLATLPTILNNSINFCFYYSSGPMFREAFKHVLFGKQDNGLWAILNSLPFSSLFKPSLSNALSLPKLSSLFLAEFQFTNKFFRSINFQRRIKFQRFVPWTKIFLFASCKARCRSVWPLEMMKCGQQNQQKPP